MTLVSHRHEFIFIKTHKTGSTSVEAALDHLCLPQGETGEQAGAHRRDMYVGESEIIGCRGSRKIMPPWRGHMSARSVRQKLGRRLWRRYFKFAVVRNPYDRLVSMYFYRMEDARREEIAAADFDQVRRDFQAWLPGPFPRNNLNKLLIGARYALDHAIYYEHLDEGLAGIVRKFGEPEIVLPRYKSETRVRPENWREFYDESSRRVVRRACGFELAFFGYDEDGGPNPTSPRQRCADLLRLSPHYAANAWRPAGCDLSHADPHNGDFRVDAGTRSK